MPLPSGRLLWLLTAASVLFLVDARLGLAADAALLLAAAADWWAVGGNRGPGVERHAPSRLPLGAAGDVAVVVHNPGRLTLRVRVTDDLQRHLEREDATAELRLPPKGRVTWRYRLRATARGDETEAGAPLGDIHLRTRGPLGLVWRERREPRADPLEVQPGVLEMRRARLLGLRERLRRAGLRRTRQRGEGRSFESLREYVRGDDPRAVDWKASARHDALVVRQYEAERSQNILLAIDAGRLMVERIGDRERLDHALSAAVLLGDVAIQHGDHVGVMVFADRMQHFLPPRRGSVQRVVDALTSVRPRLVEPNYPLAFSTLARQVGRRSLVVLFTDIIDPEASGPLLAQVSRSSRRHLVLAVTLRNPGLVAAADAAAGSEEEAFRRAAAEEMLQARRVALAIIRRAGALVADVEPGAVITEVVNRYLEVKYRGLL